MGVSFRGAVLNSETGEDRSILRRVTGCYRDIDRSSPVSEVRTVPLNDTPMTHYHLSTDEPTRPQRGTQTFDTNSDSN